MAVDLCDGAEAMPIDQRQELERRPLRMLFPPFPLADETCCDVEIAGEYGLARAFALPQGPDFLGGERTDRRQTRIVKLAHSLLVHDARRVQPFGCFVNRGHH